MTRVRKPSTRTGYNATKGRTRLAAPKLSPPSVAALGQHEQHLIVAATTIDGVALAEDDPEKLLRLPAANSPSTLRGEARGEEKTPSSLNAGAQMRKQQLLREINQRN